MAVEQWTPVHSFYAGMGGFVFDLTAPEMTEGQPFIPNQRRLHVTPRGIRLLARCGLLPDIAKEDIDDKSKTDGISKLICCIQVAWFLAQVVTRLAVGLPIAPLEINTVGHVVCALTFYMLWWHKPRWIKEPTILRGEWTPAMCAFMYMSSQVSAQRRIDRDFLRNFGVQPEIDGVLYVSSDADTTQKYKTSSAAAEVTSVPVGPTAITPQHPHTADSKAGVVIGERPKGGNMIARRDPKDDERGNWSSDPEKGDLGHAALDEMRHTRWNYACEAIEQYATLQERLQDQARNAHELRFREALKLYPEMPGSVREHFKLHNREDGPALVHEHEGLVCSSEELVVDRPRNWPGDDQIRHLQGHLMGSILWTASTIYGAIHLAGWNELFPTMVESWFWRMSAAYIVWSGLLWSGLNLLGHFSDSVWWFWYGILAGDISKSVYYVIYFLSGIGGTLYFVARSYLVLEAFISLRSLPEATYNSPAWILTVPHI